MAKGRKTGGGTRRGVPNKATTTAREAIARVADGSAYDFMQWLQQTAEGIQGEEDDEGNPRWIVRPNPEGAANLYLKAIEYHIPKLARTELTGKDGEKLPPPATIIIKA